MRDIERGDGQDQEDGRRRVLREGRYEDARKIFEEVALATEFKNFLTIPAYEYITRLLQP